MKKILFPALVVMSLAFPMNASAAPRRGMMEQPGPRIEALFRQLDLTPEQQGKLKTIRATQQKAAQPLMEQVKAKQREMFSIMKSVNGTKDQALAKQRELHALHAQLGEMRISSWFEARKILTNDQLKKLEGLKMPDGRQRKMRRH